MSFQEKREGNHYRMKKCLVIGGAGFVGTNLSRNLAGKGYDVTICDHVEGTMLSSRIQDHRYIKLNYFRQQIEDGNDGFPA